MPLVRDFLDRMRESVDWLTTMNPPRAQERLDHIARVFDFRLRAASAAHRININIEDIEQLFSLASATESPEFMNYIIESIASTLDFCAQTAQPNRPNTDIPSTHDDRFPANLQRHPLNREGYIRIELPSVYEDYVSKLLGMHSREYNPNDNTFITFNYDTILEQALWNLGFKVNYALNRFGRHNIDDLISPDGVKVLKLHGSVNWSAPGTTGRILNVYRDYAECLASGLSTFLVPPTWQKNFAGPYQQIWNETISALRKASRIIIIGFSMPETDTHFKYLISAGLQSNVSVRQVRFINPVEPSQFEPKLRKLFSPASVEQDFVIHDSFAMESFFWQHDYQRWINRPVYKP